MRRSRIFILLAIILLLGVAAVYLLVGRQPAEITPEGDATPAVPADVVFVAIAAQDISRGAKIPDDGVIMSRMNANLVVETMISGQDEDGIRSRVVGHIARQDIARGVPITEAMLTETSGDLLAGGSNAALAIPAGYTAIAVPIDRLSGIAYAMQDGDVVDVLISLLLIDVDPDFQTVLPNQTLPLFGTGGTTEFLSPFLTGGVMELVDDVPESPPYPFGKIVTEEATGQPFHVFPLEEQRPRAVTQRLVEGAIVLHVGTFKLEGEITQEIAPAVEGGVGAPMPEGQAAPPAPVTPPDIITLIVTPQEALALNWAIKVGADLTLTLRAPNDNEVTETSSVTLQYLLDTYQITVPTKLPYSIEPALETLIDPELSNDAKSAPPQ